MATIEGTILGATCLHKESFGGNGNRELWLMSVKVAGAYTASTDDMNLAGVGAAIDAVARDGKTSTLRGALPVTAANNGSGTGVYLSGASVQALAVSTDALTGELNNAALTETDSAANTSGIQIAVIVDRA